jgi:Family of unknown function (DUF6064)
VNLPFSRDQFFQVFGYYNEAVWPAQWILFGLALISIAAALAKVRFGDQAVALVLASLWTWMAIVYHWIYFAAINPAAYVFAILFGLQAALLLWLGVVKGRLVFRWPGRLRGWLGAAFVLYALIFYPLLNQALGHRYPQTPTFGLPCPTTIFTLALMMWLKRPFPLVLLVIPLIWAVIGGSAAFLLGVPQDLGLLPAGLVAMAISGNRRMRRWPAERSVTIEDHVRIR